MTWISYQFLSRSKESGNLRRGRRHDGDGSRTCADSRRIVQNVGKGSPNERLRGIQSLIGADLAVEVLSAGNIRAEMTRKVREYFDAHVKLVWLIDPKKRSARVYSSFEKSSLVLRGPCA